MYRVCIGSVITLQFTSKQISDFSNDLKDFCLHLAESGPGQVGRDLQKGNSVIISSSPSLPPSLSLDPSSPLPHPPYPLFPSCSLPLSLYVVQIVDKIHSVIYQKKETACSFSMFRYDLQIYFLN